MPVTYTIKRALAIFDAVFYYGLRKKVHEEEPVQTCLRSKVYLVMCF